ncbi:MAG: SAM-dependent methyltransferase [Acetobacteraceae bacterium]|nr:SAM-dependent methyltransferase [Acetobacteraceae bacterium]
MGDRDRLGARAVIAAEIEASGPMRLDRFMALANAAYYGSRDPLGRAGDFITAPETTQAYGELIGAWLVEVWRAQGAPAPAVLAEAGPGRGTLMADALRLIDRLAPDFAAACTLHLIETSPTLRALQAERLGARVASWHESLATLPEVPTFLVASEFLDALPVRQFRCRDGAWMERAVTLAGEQFVWTEVPAEAAPGRSGEVGEAAEAWIAEAAATPGATWRRGAGARLRPPGGSAGHAAGGAAASPARPARGGRRG